MQSDQSFCYAFEYSFFQKRITNALISLHSCAGWSAHLLFANPRRPVFLQRRPFHIERSRVKETGYTLSAVDCFKETSDSKNNRRCISSVFNSLDLDQVRPGLGQYRAHINRRAQRHGKHKTEKKKIKDPQKKYRLGTVSKIFYWRA